MARAEGSLNILERWAWRVFDSPGFAGNPTRVHALAGPADSADLLAHSRSLPSVDNAYFWREDGGARVRFFSHSGELRLCGHALLACAETLLAETLPSEPPRAGNPLAEAPMGERSFAEPPLAEKPLDEKPMVDTPLTEKPLTERLPAGAAAPGNARAETAPQSLARELTLSSGVLRHRLRREDGRLWVTLPLTAPNGSAPPLLRSLLEDAGRHLEALHAFPGQVWVAALRSLGEVESFQAAAFPWEALAGEGPGALILACFLGEGHYAFRYFAPWHGKPEDPGTGSAQSFLAALWLQEGQLGRAWQVSPQGRTAMNLRRRDGELWLNGSVVPDRQEGTATQRPAYTLGKR